jgi:hypothetical protein
MQKVIGVVATLAGFLVACLSSRASESTSEYSVQVSVAVQKAPPQITLNWPQDGCVGVNAYTVYRKKAEDAWWGPGTHLAATATSYTDTNINLGIPYEYQVVKTTELYAGYGYVCAGIEVPQVENRGKLLLVIDNTYLSELSRELGQLEQDLQGDGWSVLRLVVGRNDSVLKVKSLIRAEYRADPRNVKCVFLFGHVPVPYSGNIVPDGHAPDHQGAWPCDGYYGDMDGVWTDISVNITCASDIRNRNTPGDGKFDQSSFPADLKLMVGRVDLANMPGRLSSGGPSTFPSELALLRNYLRKDHEFRTRQFELPQRAIIGDYFGTRDGEAFAASGWRNFAAFFTATNITALPRERTWIECLSTNEYLWAYGCGAGTYTSIGGLGTADGYNDGLSTDLVKADVKAVFTLLFGSWLGDWDSEDDLQRSILATPSYGLACAWSGRPHWFLHHMALGAPIGFSTLLTQNNRRDGLYHNQMNNGAAQIHIALMGDPTLRMHVVSPPIGLVANRRDYSVELNWRAAQQDVLGYHVYRAANPSGPFTRLTAASLNTTTYKDIQPLSAPCYMVRSLILERSGSGTYYNLSQGVFAKPEQPGVISPSPAIASVTMSATYLTGSHSDLGAIAGTNALPALIRTSSKAVGQIDIQ